MKKSIMAIVLCLMCTLSFGQDSVKGFSVSRDKQVVFSHGNLQYHPKKDQWRFAKNQTDYIGKSNSNISDSYDGWLDLFGRSTPVNYFGLTYSRNYDIYCGPFIDWGTNTIGTDAPNTWRALSTEEWDYILHDREYAGYLHGPAQVNGVNGLILLPDNWEFVYDGSYKEPRFVKRGFPRVGEYAEYQSFTAAQWSELEAKGAIFLPAAGVREGRDVEDVQHEGHYQPTVRFTSDDVTSSGREDHHDWGRSVRLVKDVKQ